jgi:hypothetical protein
MINKKNQDEDQNIDISMRSVQKEDAKEYTKNQAETTIKSKVEADSNKIAESSSNSGLVLSLLVEKEKNSTEKKILTQNSNAESLNNNQSIQNSEMDEVLRSIKEGKPHCVKSQNSRSMIIIAKSTAEIEEYKKKLNKKDQDKPLLNESSDLKIECRKEKNQTNCLMNTHSIIKELNRSNEEMKTQMFAKNDESHALDNNLADMSNENESAEISEKPCKKSKTDEEYNEKFVLSFTSSSSLEECSFMIDTDCLNESNEETTKKTPAKINSGLKYLADAASNLYKVEIENKNSSIKNTIESNEQQNIQKPIVYESNISPRRAKTIRGIFEKSKDAYTSNSKYFSNTSQNQSTTNKSNSPKETNLINIAKSDQNQQKKKATRERSRKKANSKYFEDFSVNLESDSEDSIDKIEAQENQTSNITSTKFEIRFEFDSPILNMNLKEQPSAAYKSIDPNKINSRDEQDEDLPLIIKMANNKNISKIL